MQADITSGIDTPSGPGSYLRICTLSDLHNMGMTTEQVVRACLLLDYGTLNGLSNRQAGTVEQWVPVVDKSPAGVRVLVDVPNTVPGSGSYNDQDGRVVPGIRIVGYWHYMALLPEMFVRAKAGMMYDREIVVSVVRSMDVPGHYQLYFSGISVMSGYRGIVASRLLYRAFWSSLYDLRQERVYVDELCAVAYTEDGVTLCRSAHMIYLREHVDRGSIYWMSLRSI